MIKREIDAREWFVFCNSPAAAQSSYVRAEHAYIINSGKEKIWKIDMTADIHSILNTVRRICTEIEVFISYAQCDRNISQPLINAIIDKGYSVWTPEDNLQTGEPIIRCAYEGCYIVVITQKSIESSFVEKELAFATSHGDWIVPIVIGSPELPRDIRQWIGKYKQISMEPTVEDFAWVVDMLDEVVKKRIYNMNNDGIG